MLWVRSTISTSGLMFRMTPFMTPTKWSASPKSVVRVITCRRGKIPPVLLSILILGNAQIIGKGWFCQGGRVFMHKRNQRGSIRIRPDGGWPPGLPNWQGLLLCGVRGYNPIGEHLQWAKAHFFVGAIAFV